jgi:hypothetical protein
MPARSLWVSPLDWNHRLPDLMFEAHLGCNRIAFFYRLNVLKCFEQGHPARLIYNCPRSQNYAPSCATQKSPRVCKITDPFEGTFRARTVRPGTLHQFHQALHSRDTPVIPSEKRQPNVIL